MEIRVLIIEDDPITSQDLKEALLQNGFVVTGIARTFEQGLEQYHTSQPDVLLVDIKLKGEKDGIELVSKVNASRPGAFPVVYLTANSDQDTKTRAFATHPAVFLTKPFHEQDLLISLELAFNNYMKRYPKDTGDQPLFVKTTNQYVKLRQTDILYIKAEGSYSRIVTDASEYMLSINLNICTEKLSTDRFIRSHRSYLINKSKISGVSAQNLHISGHTLPIGRKYKNDVVKLLPKLS